MLTVNGKQYAKNNAEFTSSLFNPGGTCVGFYRKNKGGIVLMDMQKEPFVFIVNNQYGERFFVSCVKQEDGRMRYFFSLTDRDAKILGVEKMGYCEEIQAAHKAIESMVTA